MIRKPYIIGLVFFALACCFAFSPTQWTASASAQMELQDGSDDGGGGGKTAGDPDMPDTQPPPTGTDTYGGGYGRYGAMESFRSGMTNTTAVGSGAITFTSMDWWQSVWLALRVQLGW